ncbi:MAG: glycosyltransferase [Saprospiraceae bacterium]
MLKSKHIVIAPLYWGLGHAARCIPIIKSLLVDNYVSIASDGEALKLLTNEFPSLDYYPLPGYNIEYKYGSMSINMILQSPHVLRTIRAEKKAAIDISLKSKANVLISDNRFGFRCDSVYNIYITHQITVASNNIVSETIASKLHQKIINRFDECWVPDFEGKNALAGKLSQNNLKIPTTYLGPLSRMKSYPIAHKYDIAIILSGPEPQRTILEKLLVSKWANTDINVCLVRGTEMFKTKNYPSNFEVFDMLETIKLNEVINASTKIVCRAGYTSIMDLVSLKKQAILIPTPGQYEQEYLATLLNGKHDFEIWNQKDLKG